MKIKQINPAVFKSLSLEFQTYIDDNITGSVLCAIYHQGKLVYYNKFGWKDFFLPEMMNCLFNIFFIDFLNLNHLII